MPGGFVFWGRGPARPKDRRMVVPKAQYMSGYRRYTLYMSNYRALLSLFLFISISFSSASSICAAALDALPELSGVLVPDAPAPLPLLPAETYPDYEQDRKPASLVYSGEGRSVIGGVRFERFAETGLYAWREVSFENEDLKEVYWGYRSGGTGHIFYLFTFGDAKSGDRPVRGVVVEALPWKKKGEGFSPFGAGVSGHYPLVWNVVEWESFLATSIDHDGLSIDIYPMKVSREEKLRLLDEAVKAAVTDLKGEKYHTFFNSCSSNALKVFKAATGHRLLIAKMLPTVVVKHMKLRGFLGKRQRYDASNRNN